MPLELRGGVDGRELAGHPPLGPDLPQGVVGDQVTQPRTDARNDVEDESGVQEAAVASLLSSEHLAYRQWK